jgi:hypothetical protein
MKNINVLLTAMMASGMNEESIIELIKTSIAIYETKRISGGDTRTELLHVAFSAEILMFKIMNKDPFQLAKDFDQIEDVRRMMSPDKQ